MFLKTFALLAAATVSVCHADILLEGFENGNLSHYTTVALGGQTTAAVAAQYAHDGTYGLGLDGTNWYYRDDAAVQVSRGESFYAWVETAPGTGSRDYFGFGASSSGTLSVVLAPNTNQFIIQDNTSYNFLDIGAVSQSYTADTWYKIVVNWGVGGSITADLYASDGTTLLNTVTAVDNAITGGGLAFRSFDTGPGAFDTVTLIQPTPEPSSVVLFGLLLGSIAIFARRRFGAHRADIRAGDPTS